MDLLSQLIKKEQLAPHITMKPDAEIQVLIVLVLGSLGIAMNVDYIYGIHMFGP